MTSRLRTTSQAALLSFGITVGAFVPALVTPVAAQAQTLPAPYVSRALDAVLLPIDDAVADAFGLGPDAYGALVLATQPGGWADAAGILPGDVIETVQTRQIADPIQIDEVVLYWLNQGISDFAFDIWRDGQLASSSWTITEDSYYQVIEITTISSWSSYSSESFSYESWYAEYSETISESYSSSETLIEETITSEEFTSEVTTEETVTEETVTEEMATEETATEETSTEETATEEVTTDETATEDAGTDGGAVDDGDTAGTEDPGAGDAGAEDTGGDAGGDAGGDSGGDAGGDSGGDAGGDAGGDSGGDAGGDSGGDAGGDDAG